MVKYTFSLAVLAVAASAVAGQTLAPVTVTIAPVAALAGTVAPVAAVTGLATTAPATTAPGTTAPLGVSSAPVTVAPVPAVVASAAPISGTNTPVSGTAAPVLAPVPVPAPFLAPTPTGSTTVDYFDAPQLKWSTTVGSGLGSGNAVTVSPDGLLVYVTRSNGQLDVLQASDGKLKSSITPELNAAGNPITCSSGVYFGNLFGQQFAAYAIIDQPVGTGFESSSRIVAVSHPGGEHLFTSEAVSGKIVGTPIITKTGQYIYATHNENLDSTTLSPVGSFSIFYVPNNGTVLWTEKSDATVAADAAPYSGLGVAHSPSSGKYTGGELNTNDIVVWTTATEKGTGGGGYTRAFQLPFVFDLQLVSVLETVRLFTVRWNAIARPTLSIDGQALYAVVRQSGIRGWTGSTAFDTLATWTGELTTNAEIPGTPIQNAATLSKSQTLLFVTTAATEINGLNATSGNILWKYTSAAIYTSEPQVSPDDTRVYAMQADGNLDCIGQTSGTSIWAASCASLNPTCSGSVASEFSVSSNGLVVYYGDSAGNIQAVQVGYSATPTIAPTNFPSMAGGVTDAPVVTTGAPVTSAPVSGTMAPGTTAPGTTAPGTMAPVTSAPASMTVAPATAAPSVTSEGTVAPVEVAPTTPKPTAPSPAPSADATMAPTSAASQFTLWGSAFLVGMAVFMN